MDQQQQPQPITLDELLTRAEREISVLRAQFHRAVAEINALRERLAELERPATSPAGERPENVVALPTSPTGAAD